MRVLGSFGFLLLAFLAAPVWAADEPPTVVEVRFEGNRRYSDAYLRERIETKAGQKLDGALLVRDEKTLRNFFSQVAEVKEIDVEGGVVVVFVVRDRVVVGKVIVEGMVRVPEEEYTVLLSTRAGRPLLEHTLRADKRLLERLLREKGHHFAEVIPARIATNRGDVQDVKFRVFPSNRVKVHRVVLEGAHSLERADILRPVVNSDRWRHTITGWISPSYFRREVLEEDRQKIQLTYHQEGFLDARVVLVGHRFLDKKRKKVLVHYRVDEGKRYTLNKITVVYGDKKGDRPPESEDEWLSPKSLAALSVMVKGDPFRREDLARTIRDMQERLRSRRYALARVDHQITPNPVRRTVDLTFFVATGQKIRLGRLRIAGNVWTKNNVLRRAFRPGAMPGDELDVNELQTGMNRLRRTRFFKFVRYVGIPSKFGLFKSRDPDRPDEWDVAIEVEEQRTRNITLGGSVSTDGGFFGIFQVEWRNFDLGKWPRRPLGLLDSDAFRGGGQQFTVNFSPGTTFTQGRLSFFEPSVQDSFWSFGFNLSQRLARLEDYDLLTSSVNVRVGRFLDPRQFWHIQFEWIFKQERIDDPEPDAPQIAIDAQGTTKAHGIGITIRYDRRRDFETSLVGSETKLTLTYYGGFLGEELDIIKAVVEHNQGWKVFRTRSGLWHRVRLRVTVGYAAEFGDTDVVPIFERFFLGGRNLRGFDFREVGPRSNGRPTGGEFMTLIVTEYTIPLSGSQRGGFGVDFVLFVDQGTVAEDISTFGNGGGWRLSVGFGVAVRLPGGNQPPLRLDFGFPLLDEDGDERQVFSFSVQRFF